MLVWKQSQVLNIECDCHVRVNVHDGCCVVWMRFWVPGLSPQICSGAVRAHARVLADCWLVDVWVCGVVV